VARTTSAGALALIASILFLASASLSWYTVSLSASNGSSSVTVNLYPGDSFNTTSTSGASTTGSTTTYSEAKLTETGNLYAILQGLLLLGAIVGITGASLLLVAGGESRSAKSWGTALVAFAVLMALVSPLVLLAAQPTALAHDSYNGSDSNSQTNGPTSSFFGSNSSSAYTATWGPSIGWYLSFLVFVMLAISWALVPSSDNEPAAIPGPPGLASQGAYGAYNPSPGFPYAQPPWQPQLRYAQTFPVMQPPPVGNSQFPVVSYPVIAPPSVTAPHPPPPPPATSAGGYCSYCGTGNAVGGSYCRHCGRPLAFGPPTIPPT
jgi:hypothetical protein